MQQVILTEPGKIELRSVPDPVPAEGEVVIKVNTALTCGTDLKAFMRGHSLIPMPGPFGHEYSGTVAMTGSGLTSLKEGDAVMGVHSAPCRACTYCTRSLYHLCQSIMDQKVLGAFSDYLLLPRAVTEQNLFKKPAHLSFEEAALLEPLSCVIHSYGKLRLQEVQTAVVVGAGPVGLMHLVFLKAKGLAVIQADYSLERLALASAMGADSAVSPDGLEDLISRETLGMGADLVIECTGQQGVWEETVSYVRRGGTVLLFGGCPAGTKVTYDTHRLHYDELTLAGSFHYTPDDVKSAFHILDAGNLDLSPLISGSFPLQDIERALILLKEGKGIKYAIKP